MKNFLLWSPPSKAPFSVDETGKRIIKNYPKHLLTYQEAETATFTDESLSIGFYVTKGFCLIDLDSCFDDSLPDHKHRLERLQFACRHFSTQHSYMHPSSGKGFHIIIKASTQLKWKNRSGDLEVYTDKRFCACKVSEALVLVERFEDQSEKLDEFLKLYLDANAVGETLPVAETVGETHATQEDLKLAATLLNRLPADCSNEVWQSLGLAMGNTFRNGLREKACKVFERWSARSSKFDQVAALRIADFFDESRQVRSDGVGMGTLMFHAEQVLGESFVREARLNVVQTAGLQALQVVESSHVGVGIDGETDGSGDSEEDDDCGDYWASCEELPAINYKDDAQQVAESFLAEGVLKCGDSIFCYEEYEFEGIKQGHWEKAEAIDYLKKHLARFIHEKKYNWTYRGKARVQVVDTSLNLMHLNTVIQHVFYLSYDQQMPVINTFIRASEERLRDGTFVPVQNGILKIETGEILPYGKHFFNTGILACRYEPKKLATRFLRGISHTFDGDVEAQRVFTEWLGYLLLPQYHAKKILVLNGESDSGKSQLARLMLELVSKGFSSALDKLTMGTQFALAGLDRKLIVLMDDFPMDSLTGSVVTRLKQITSGTEQEIQQKHEHVYSALITAKPVITTNCSARSFEDPEGALMRRVLILNCVRVPEAERVREWAKVVAREELAGVLNIAVVEARRLLSGDSTMLKQPSQGESADLWNSFNVAGADPMQWFVENCIHLDVETQDGFGVKGLSLTDIREALIKYYSRDTRFLNQMDSTPVQGTCQKIAKMLKRKFGERLISKKSHGDRMFVNIYVKVKDIDF